MSNITFYVDAEAATAASAAPNAAEPILAPLVLSGPPRSGTTLLSALLDGHSGVAWLLDEAYFFEHLHVLGPDNFERFLRAAALGADSLIEGLRDRSLMPPTHVPPSDFPALSYAWSETRFRARLAEASPRSIGELWRLLRDAYLDGLDLPPRPYVTLKAADYGRSVAGALEHFPTARGILVVREPVAALNSLKAYRAQRGAKRLTWPTLVEAVVAMNKLAALADRFGPGRLTVMRYEDFTAAPGPAMRGLCDWLGLGFEPAVAAPSMMGRAWSNNSSFAAGAAGEAPLPRARAELLSPHERDYIHWATEPFRARFGY